jgi:hypothetical protein
LSRTSTGLRVGAGVAALATVAATSSGALASSRHAQTRHLAHAVSHSAAAGGHVSTEPAATNVSPSAAVITVTLTKKGIAGLPTYLTPGWHTFIVKQGTPKADARTFGTAQVLDPHYSVKQLLAVSAQAQGNGPSALKALIRLFSKARIDGGITTDRTLPGEGKRVTALFKTGTAAFHNGSASDSPKAAPETVAYVPVYGTPTGHAPKAIGSIRPHEYGFFVQGLKAGNHTYAIKNSGSQVHFVEIDKLLGGHTAADVKQALQTSGPNDPPPPWIKPVAFLDLLSPKGGFYTDLNLSKGNYMGICFMPEQKKTSLLGTPHAFEGMVTGFSVH